MKDRIAHRFIRFGVALLLLGLGAGLLAGLTVIPRLAVATHVTMMISGVMFIAFGLIWPKVRLSERQQQWTFRLLAAGALGNLATGMTSAFLGIGGGTLSISAAGAVGSDGAEALVKLGILAVVACTTTGVILVWLGLRGTMDESAERRPRVTGRSAAVGLLVLLVGGPLAFSGFVHNRVKVAFEGAYPVELPPYEMAPPVWLWDDSDGSRAQNWTPDDWQWFYHASQGGAFELPVPYDWVMALERPEVALWPPAEVPLLMTPEYLGRFGFLLDPATSYDPSGLSIEVEPELAHLSTLTSHAENNPDRLPVGFTKAPGWLDQSTGRTIDAMGFTCAACHTGQLDYYELREVDGAPDSVLHRIRIEGGPANVDLGAFRTAVGIGLALTDRVPGRFDRFADRLGATSDADEEALRADLQELLARGLANKERDSVIYPTKEGFARLDAIGRIANFVFGTDLAMEENYDIADAPVNFPHIWDAPWFEWVQYNASFKQPMMRNAGESMGVFASVDMVGEGHDVPVSEDEELFRSSVDVVSLHEMETLLAGKEPFAGLRSPTWPDVFPPVDPVLAAEGKDVYERRCSGCHLPASNDPGAFWADQNWTPPDEYGNRYLALPVIDLWTIGTDPGAAVNFYTRVVELGPLGDRLGRSGIPGTEGVSGMTTAGVALPLLIRETTKKRYDDLEIPASLRPHLDGYRPDEIQAPLGYRARPLNGIWATPPFLHNGSVPTLAQLLSPQSERPDTFHLGSRRFDPVNVGISTEAVPGAFFFDTSLPGNSNEGHLFEGDDDPESAEYWRGRKGVVGPALTDTEGRAVIEFLKQLPPLPTRPTDRNMP